LLLNSIALLSSEHGKNNSHELQKVCITVFKLFKKINPSKIKDANNIF